MRNIHFQPKSTSKLPDLSNKGGSSLNVRNLGRLRYVSQLLFGLVLLLCAHAGYGQNIFSGEPVQVVGRMQGYNTAAAANTTYRRLSVASGTPTDGRGQWMKTYNVQASGGDFTADNMPGGGGAGFLFISGPSGNRFANKWVFGGVGQAGLNNTNASTYQGSTDMGLNMGTNGRYTFVFNDAGYTSTNADFYVGYTASDPVTVTRASETINGDNSATIAITSSATPSAGENIYVRYVTGLSSDFSGTPATSFAQATGSGTSWSATIPTQSGGTRVRYYIFTSTRTLAQLNAHSERQKSLVTLRYDDNSGANYTYDIPSGIVSAQSGPWNVGSTWVGGVVPTSAATILNTHTVTLTSNTASMTTVTINAGGTLDGGVASNTLNIAAAGTITINGTLTANTATIAYAGAGTLANNGTFTAGTSTVTFAGGSTLSGSVSTYAFNNVTIGGGGINLSNKTINGTLKITTGGFVSNAPTYGASSTLMYSLTNGSAYGVSNEWTGNAAIAGVGVPQNVTMENLTGSGNITINMPNTSRGMAGNLTVPVNSTFALSNSAGADLYVGGSIVVAATAGWTNNSRAVFLNGLGTQALERTSGTLALDLLFINKGDGEAILNSNVSISNTLNFQSATSYLNLNGQTLTLNGGLTTTAGGGFKGTTASTLSIGGSGALGTMSFVSGFRNLLQLTLNRVSSGTVTMGSDLTVAGLTCTNGLLLTNGNTLIYTGTVAPTASSTSYVAILGAGGFAWSMSGAAAGAYKFPIGPNGTVNGYRPMTLTTSAVTTAIVRIGFVNTQNAAASATAVPTATNNRANYIANIDLVSGSLPTSSLSMGYQAGDFNTAITDSIFIHRWTGLIWQGIGHTSNAAADGNTNITRANLPSSSLTGAFLLGMKGGEDFSTYVTIANGNWNSASTWLNSAIPNGLTHNVVIAHNTIQNQNASVKSLRVNTGVTLTQNTNTLTVAAGGTLTNNSGSFLQGGGQTGKVVFNGAATLSGTFSFYDVELNGSVGLANCTINGSLELRPNAAVTSAPTYVYGASASNLVYNTGGTYNRNNEWSTTAGAGYPNNVEVRGNTTLDLSSGGASNGVARQMAGNLLVVSGSTVTMATMTEDLSVRGSVTLNGALTLGGVGGDVNIGGDLTINTGAALNANSREVTFNGTAAQAIAGTIATFPTLPFLNVDKSAGTLTLNKNITVSTRLRLSNGSLNNSSNTLTINNAASIERTIGTISNAPVFGTAVNISYLGSTEVTTGAEVPATASVLNNLIVSNTGNVKLGGNMTVNGTATISAGDLDLNGNNILSLGTAATLAETTGNTVINSTNSGTGYIETIRTLNAPNIATNIAGMGVYIGTASNLGSTSVRRYPVSRDLAASPLRTSITRIYRIVPTSNGTGTTFRFDYDDSELNGLLEAPLGLYRATVDNINGTWNLAGIGGVIDGTNNRLTGATIAGSDNLSFFWALGGPVNRTIADGPWNQAATWSNGVPVLSDNVQIMHNVYLTANASINAVAVSPGGSLKLYDLSNNPFILEINNGGSLIRNGGTFDPGTGTVNFSGAGSVISGSIGFYNVRMSGGGGVDFGVSATISNQLEITNTAATITNNAPTYNVGSTLFYNVGGGSTFNRGNEWRSGTTGQGIPSNVTIGANMTLNMGSHADSRTVRGNITITGNLTASSAAGGDLNIGGNWTRSGTFTTNTRSVTFNGTSPQSINSNTTFQALNVDNPTHVFLNDNVSATTFELMAGRTFRLNGYKLTILSTGSRQLNINTGATFEAGTGSIDFEGEGLFTCNGTFDRGTSTVAFKGTSANNTLAGTVAINFHNVLTFGRIDFSGGTGGRGRLSGTMDIGPQGFVPNAPFYEVGSTLRYNGGGSYNRTTEWDGSTLYNVTVANGTVVDMTNSEGDRDVSLDMAGNLHIQNGTITLDDTRRRLAVGGNVTIESGQTLQLSNTAGGDLYIGGNLIVNSLNFNANTRAVRFNGTGAQSISGTQEPVFQYLEIGKPSGTLTLNRTIRMDHPTNEVTDVHFTVDNAGTFDLNGMDINRDNGNAGSLLRLINGTLKTGGTVFANTSGKGFTRYTYLSDIFNQNDQSRVGGKFEYSSGSAETIHPITYNTLATSGNATKTLSSSVTANDSLIVESGSTLSLAATSSIIDVKTGFKINGTVSGSSTGKVRLSGSSAQGISGTGTVRNLEISNAQGANLTGYPTVSNTVVLTLGDIRSNSTSDTLILGSTATITEDVDNAGAGADHYVIGNLKTVRSVGTAAESFGGMGFTLSAGSNLGTVTMTRVSGTTGAVTANGFTGINRKWVVTPTVQPASPDRNVTMVWPSDDDNGKTLTAFQFWKSPDGIQPYVKFGNEQSVNVNPRTGTVSGIASFSTITGNDASEPLPVQLLFFSAKNSAGNGYLYWATASEIDNKGFVIEKSTDGVNFYDIGFVPAVANSKGRNQYNFTDYELSVNSYYRLRQIDLDGQRYEYSHKVLVKVGKQAADISLYPNPTAGNVDIRINGGNEFTDEMTVTLYSIEGRQVVQHGGVLSAINQDLNRTVATLAQGMYVVKITLADEIHTIKLIKE